MFNLLTKKAKIWKVQKMYNSFINIKIRIHDVGILQNGLLLAVLILSTASEKCSSKATSL